MNDLAYKINVKTYIFFILITLQSDIEFTLATDTISRPISFYELNLQ